MSKSNSAGKWSQRLKDARQRLSVREQAAQGSSKLLPRGTYPPIISMFEGSGTMRPWAGVSAALQNAINNPAVFEPESYFFSQVHSELLQQIQIFFREECKISWVNKSNICIGHGVSHLLDAWLSFCIAPGDVVVTPAPFYHSFAEFPEKWGGTLEVIQTSAENEFKLTAIGLRNWYRSFPEKEKVKLLILTNPSISGAVYNISELEDLAEVVAELGIPVFVDEVYRDHIYEDVTFTSLASLPGMDKLTVTAHSGSKTRGAADYRVGWACGPEEVVARMIHYAEYSVTNISKLIQIAATEVLRTPRAYVDLGLRECEKRLNLIYRLSDELNDSLKRSHRFFSDMEIVKLVCRVAGGHNLILDLNILKGMILPSGRVIQSSLDLCEYLMGTPEKGESLKSGGIALSPCYSSGLDGIFVRISFADVGHQYVSQALLENKDFVIARACLARQSCTSEQACLCFNESLEPAFARGREFICEAFNRLALHLDLILSINGRRYEKPLHLDDAAKAAIIAL